MIRLSWHDLQFALRRMPRTLLAVMKDPHWHNRIFVGGGFIRSIVTGEPINDIDIFVSSEEDAHALATVLVAKRCNIDMSKDDFRLEGAKAIKKRIYETNNALTLCCFTPTLQIIHRWVFEAGPKVVQSFDFTICAAALWYGPRLDGERDKDDEPQWFSCCDDRFYQDLAAKRLVYRNPVRNEDAGGSMLRVLKYYQKGYRIPLDSLANVITRLVQGVDLDRQDTEHFSFRRDDVPGDSPLTREVWMTGSRVRQDQFSKVIAGLLREVDPAIDPSHIAHLPAENVKDTEPTLE